MNGVQNATAGKQVGRLSGVGAKEAELQAVYGRSPVIHFENSGALSCWSKMM
jgi:hypothetical protein